MSYIEALEDFESWRSKGRPGAGAKVDLFATYMIQDSILVARGMPATTPWWIERIREFYVGGFRRFIARVGRKGIKSSIGCRFAVNEVLNSPHVHNPGDIIRWPLLSIDKGEAADRKVLLTEILRCLDRHVDPSGDELRIKDTPCSFSVRAGTVGAVSGPISKGFTLDELAKWRDKDGANPATTVIKSLTPSTATQPNAHELWISSPWAEDDAHFEAVEKGTYAPSSTDGGQLVAIAPTWVANPTITEAQTHVLEPDEPSWQREYAAIPMKNGAVKFFDTDVIKEAVKRGAWQEKLVLPRKRRIQDSAGAGGDFGFDSDSSAGAVAHGWAANPADLDGDQIYACAELVEHVPANHGGALKPGYVVAQHADMLKRHGLESMMADAHYRRSIEEHLETAGLEFEDAPTGALGKAQTYVKFRTLLHQGSYLLTDRDDLSKRLVTQLGRVISKPMPGGLLRIESPRIAGGGHGDIVSALVLASWVVSLGRNVNSSNPAGGVPSRWQRGGLHADDTTNGWHDRPDELEEDDGESPFSSDD